MTSWTTDLRWRRGARRPDGTSMEVAEVAARVPCSTFSAMEPAVVEQRVRALLARGDGRGAATEALSHFGPQIERYLRALLDDEADAADAFSSFAETLWKALPGYRGDASLRTWCFRVAWSAARAVRREAWYRRARRFRTGEASAIGIDAGTRSFVREERQRQALLALRRSLALEEQSLLELRVDQQLSWAEIAQVLSTPQQPVSADAVLKRYERLKRRLERMARERGLLD